GSASMVPGPRFSGATSGDPRGASRRRPSASAIGSRDRWTSGWPVGGRLIRRGRGRRRNGVMDPSAGISFIVTVYNKRPYLPAVAAGLVAQRGDFPCEFVFVDDGSTDGSREEIERLTAGWPDVQILSQANLGPSLATNRGLA